MSKERPAPRGRTRSFAITGWPLRFKVALAIAIPLLLAATLGGLQVRNDLNESANSSASSKQVTILPPTVDYLSAAERAMVAAQDPTGASDDDLDAAVKDIQAAADELTKARDSADLTEDQRYQLDAMLDLSRAMRQAGTDSLSADTWIAQLRQLQSGVTQLISSIVNEQIDPEPRLELLSQTLTGRFSLAMQQALAATDRSGSTGSQDLFAEVGVEGAAIDRLASGLGDSESETIADLRTANAERSHTIRTKGTDLGGPQAYTQYDALTSDLLDGIDEQLATSADDARRSAVISGALLLAALLATILLAFLVSKLLLNPIRRVREGARDVAHEQLPEAVARIRAGHDPGPITPIPVTTNEEVGQLARAVDDLHEQAVTLASGEARLKTQVSEMFITLSRRNTSLINQQLGFIETLEKDEEDPQRLESLFRLDHLAARMRRTADSLLVLADAPTHTSADDDLTVASALHAATAGVQDYRRTRVGSASSALIRDVASADVVHLLTELVDNALAYSGPTTVVQLSSSSTTNGVRVEIEDSGLGIPGRELATYNETLRAGGDVTPETARRMGLFVVSRLAERHGISVSLERNAHNGTTAVVLIPSSILEIPTPAAPGPPPEPSEEQVAPPSGHIPGLAAAAGPPTLEQRLNAVTGLPRRQPGAQTPNTGLPPATPQEPAAEAPPAVEPVVPTPPESTPAVEPGPTPVPAQAASSSAEAVSPPPAEAPPEEAPTPLRTASSYDLGAGGAQPSPLAYSDPGSDTPIFRALRSAWLSSHATDDSWRSSEVEAGWAQADRVAESVTEAPVNDVGLPVRRPGTSLVPGGVAKPATAGARDPEAIRARLSAHAAGVSRGRATAATAPDNQQSEDNPG